MLSLNDTKNEYLETICYPRVVEEHGIKFIPLKLVKCVKMDDCLGLTRFSEEYYVICETKTDYLIIDRNNDKRYFDKSGFEVLIEFQPN